MRAQQEVTENEMSQLFDVGTNAKTRKKEHEPDLIASRRKDSWHMCCTNNAGKKTRK